MAFGRDPKPKPTVPGREVLPKKTANEDKRTAQPATLPQRRNKRDE